MFLKKAIDDECLECPHFKHLPVHISSDAYYDHPSETDCDFGWRCPYIECIQDCANCDASFICEEYDDER
jgi:hypothetical protein